MTNSHARVNRVQERRTFVTVHFSLSHPYWEGDGKDEEIAVQTLRHAFNEAMGEGDSYDIEEVETR